MDRETILRSDLIDIVFENRNKSYGAYDLRKFYNQRLVKSIAFTLGAVAVLSAFTFLPEKKSTERPEVEVKDFVLGKDNTAIAEKKKEAPAPKPKEVNVNQSKLVAQFKIVKKNDRADSLDAIKDNDVIGSTSNTTTDPGTVATVGFIPGTATDPGIETIRVVAIVPAIDVKTPRESAEYMPAYPGGMEALRRFLAKNLVSPGDLQEGETVSVKIRFVVNYDGKLQGFSTVEDGGEAYNKEVVRVLKKMPQWIPGKSNGENVSVYFTIPVKFVPSE